MPTELKHLRVLIAVAETGSFSAAAIKLNAEVSSVSRAIATLEGSIGGALFIRSTRGVVLTSAGEEYLASARDVLERVDRAERDAKLAAQGRTGKLRIGFVWPFSSGPIVELLRMFSAAHPDIFVDTFESGRDNLVAKLDRGDVDVALIVTETCSARSADAGQFLRLSLWPEPLWLAVPEATSIGPVDWSSLAGRRLLCRPTGEWRRFAAYVQKLGGPSFTVVEQDISREGLVGLVAAG